MEQLSLSPFSRAIDAEVLPPDFGVPKFNRYEPKTDAYTHLIHYRQIMSLYFSSDAVLCKVFPTSLVLKGRSGSTSFLPGQSGASETLSEPSWLDL